MNPTSITNAWITSLIRMVLALIGGFLIRKGYVDSSLWEATVGAIIGGAITAFWSLWEKYKVSEHINRLIKTAVSMPSGTPVEVVKTAQAEKDAK
jgi:hypothetical protein